MAKVSYTIPKIFQSMGNLVSDFYNNQIGKHFKPLLPTVIVLNVDYRCDARCVMCSNWKRGSEHEVTIEEYDRIFQDPVYTKVENVNISGGEPTLRKDLPQIVQTAHLRFPNMKKIGISSTGINKYASEILEEIARYCQKHNIALSIRISLDGVGKMHDEIRRIPNAYDKAMFTIKHLKSLETELDFSLGISSTFCLQNYNQCDELHELTSSLNIDTVYAPALESEESYNSTDTEGDFNIPEEGKKKLRRFYEDRIKEGSLLNGNTFFYTKYIKYLNANGKIERDMPCPFSDQGIVIEPDGDMKYCLNSGTIGNALKNTSSNIYYNPKNLEERSKFESTICRECLLPCFTLVSARKRIFPYLTFVVDALRTKLSVKMRKSTDQPQSPKSQDNNPKPNEHQQTNTTPQTPITQSSH